MKNTPTPQLLYNLKHVTGDIILIIETTYRLKETTTCQYDMVKRL